MSPSGAPRWDPPADGVWWLTREHFPGPVSGMFVAVFPPVTRGWLDRGRRYGLIRDAGRFMRVNGWVYYSQAPMDPPDYAALDAAAAEALATKSWREEVRAWLEVERPAVVAGNEALAAVDLAGLDDPALADHFARAVAHVQAVAPLHFAHGGFDLAGGLLFQATDEWGLDDVEVLSLLAGASPATTRTRDHMTRIVAALDGVVVGDSASLDDIRDINSDAAAAIDGYLADCGWSPLEGSDVSSSTLADQPGLVVTSIRAALAQPPVPSTIDSDIEALRAQVPEADRPRFDELLADARLTYQLRDDDNAMTYGRPLGIIRLALLEMGRRLVARGALVDVADVFETNPEEVVSLLVSGQGPSADEVHARAQLRVDQAGLEPPIQVGQQPETPPGPPLPEHMARVAAIVDRCWSVGSNRAAAAAGDGLHGTGIGTGTARGRACIIDTAEGIADLQPGDVLVATTTACSHNPLFPIVVAVATEEGGLFSHPALLAREFGIPAVVGVAGLLDHVHHGDLIEVDAATGTVRRG